MITNFDPFFTNNVERFIFKTLLVILKKEYHHAYLKSFMKSLSSKCIHI